MSVSDPETPNPASAADTTSAADGSATADKPATRTTLLAAFAGTAVAAGVIAAGAAMPAVGSMAAVANTAIDSFESYPTDLGDPKLPQRSVIQYSDGETMAFLWEENRVSVPLDEISQRMQQAIVAVEDSRFYEHNGVDVRGTARALVTNQGSGEIQQGGSTITQQFVKMILLNNADTKAEQAAATERSAERKLREARFAIAMEKEKSKQEILNGYLNIAYFGSGAYGVESAAQTYFRKHAKNLSLLEAATLAGAVQQPGAFDPIRNPKASKERRNMVLGRMRDLGYITQTQFEQASKVPTKRYVDPRFFKNGCPTSDAPYFCDYVLNYIRNEPTFGPTRKDRISLLKTGGLTIRTTLDPGDQRSSQNAVENYIPIGDASRKASAISMVQPGTGKVLAMAQNTVWGTKGIGKTAYNYNVRKDEGGTIGMQSGSTFKPFTLAAALEKGISPYVSISSPSVRTFYGFQDCQGYGFPPYTVRGGGGVENMYSGTAGSINTFFVGLEQMVSLCRQAEIAEAMGVRKGDGEPLNRVPSFVLGANEVTPLDMAGAFAGFDNDGVWCKPNPVNKIKVTETKKEVYDFQPQCRRVLSSNVADTITTLLAGPVSGGGTAPNANFGRPIRGKTGTTDSSSAVWFVGYSPQIAAAVWVGDPRGGYRYPMRNVYVNGSYYGEVFGATLPAPIWRQAMAGAHEDLPYEDFGGGPKKGYINLDSNDQNAKPEKPEQERERNKQKSEPSPEPSGDEGIGDIATDLLDNLPEFDFGN